MQGDVRRTGQRAGCQGQPAGPKAVQRPLQCAQAAPRCGCLLPCWAVCCQPTGRPSIISCKLADQQTVTYLGAQLLPERRGGGEVGVCKEGAIETCQFLGASVAARGRRRGTSSTVSSSSAPRFAGGWLRMAAVLCCVCAVLRRAVLCHAVRCCASHLPSGRGSTARCDRTAEPAQRKQYGRSVVC